MFKWVNWKFALLLFLLQICLGEATEYQPWLGNYYEFEVRSSFMYQKYPHLSLDSHFKKYSSDDIFLNISLCNALPDPAVGIELEFTQAKTRRQKGDLDQIKGTGRYVWQDDIAGDPLSIITGLSYAQAFYYSLKDVSSFHHGFSNIECFLSIGKEFPTNDRWDARWWTVFAFGIAERGSPWLRFHLAYEKQWGDKHEMKIFLHSLTGLGQQRLSLHAFHGYGPIQHRSIDIGLRYNYLIDFYGSASVEYSYRVYAHNFPSSVHHILVQILYTFGL